jgi:hypothetical protein
MNQEHFFPYYINEDINEGWIFSALDCECSRMDIKAKLDEGTINQNYYDLLIGNLHEGTVKEQRFEPI